MPATVQGTHLVGDHSSRPAANAAGLPVGTIYSCTDHGTLDQTDGSTWSTYYASGVGLETPLDFIIDGGGSVIATGVAGFIEVPFDCEITAVRLLADQSGSIVVDIWADSYANYPPTNADSITASATPTISSATKSQDTTLTGWTTAITAGTILGFNVDSATSIERVTVALTLVRT